MDDAVAACVGWSLSSRRAWIEIPLFAWPSGPRVGRSPHGERGLKLRHARLTRLRIRRSPHGERGLKCMRSWLHRGRRGSLSSRRAWIEITIPDDSRVVLSGRSPHGERGLKSIIGRYSLTALLVALLTESVD